MTIGVFSLDALKQLPFSNKLISQLITLELFIIWLHLVRFYIGSYLDGNFSYFIKSITNQFGIGTWVAGCSVLAILFLAELPSWHIIIWVIALLAFAIWLFYLKLVFANGALLLYKKKKICNGVILLSAVSTQSIVLLINSLSHKIPIFINQILIIFGYFFYLIGIVMISRFFLSIKFKRLILGWSNTNSIIHGALSITGLASTLTYSINDKIIIYTWLSATCLFVLVEGISLIKVIYQIRIAGWKGGIFVYKVSQWSRIFTYCMYYTFTFSILNYHLLETSATIAISQYGQYVVLGFLLVEIILFLYNELIIRARQSGDNSL
ncbi:hypothetical protein AQUSIP_23780 [Aquicella siphonis]|uniref:Uncharacterized protein n=1 Tax=Aquicella siphonis TaxID=254247 RepID=A0A5E4PKV7_9COXI|nr:hypothetical protein [Aquicella siphonis]VVC77051.1 hypothetical protein AQUSIP_23780 [Aquicella siphonis]